MSLNGLYPVLIFQFFKEPDVYDVLYRNGLKGFINNITKTDFSEEMYPSGTPIPVYLTEESGIIIKEQSTNLSADISYVRDVNTGNMRLEQNPKANTSILRLQADSNSSVILMLSTLLQLCWKKIITKNYNLSYYNDAIFIKQAKVGSLSINQSSDNSLINIEIAFDEDFAEESVSNEEYVRNESERMDGYISGGKFNI